MKKRVAPFFMMLTLSLNVLAQNANYNMIAAIGDSDLDALKEAFDKGAQVNFLTEDGTTPIMEAVVEDDKEVIEYLLSKSGINCNVCDKEGKNVLHYMKDSEEAVAFLDKFLMQGAQINKQDEDGNTPLILAVDKDNAELVKALLQKGADVNISNGEQTAWDIALEKDDSETMASFAFGKLDSEIATSVLCYSTSVEAMKKLIAMGADINASCNEDGESLLILAIIEDEIELTKNLIELGANINAKAKDGMPAVFFTSNNEILNLLIANKVDLTVTYNGKTILQEFVELYIGFPLNAGYDNALDFIKAVLESGYTAPKDFGGKSISKFIDEYEFELPNGASAKPEVLQSMKDKNKARKEELKKYLKSKGIR